MCLRAGLVVVSRGVYTVRNPRLFTYDTVRFLFRNLRCSQLYYTNKSRSSLKMCYLFKYIYITLSFNLLRRRSTALVIERYRSPTGVPARRGWGGGGVDDGRPRWNNILYYSIERLSVGIKYYWSFLQYIGVRTEQKIQNLIFVYIIYI